MRWSDVGGLEGVKQGLKEAVQWPHLHPDALSRLGAQPPRGTFTLTVLLTPPKHSAFMLNRRFVLQTKQELCRSGVGHGQSSVGNHLAPVLAAACLPMLM